MNLHETDPLPIIGAVLLFVCGLLLERRKHPNNPRIVVWVALGTVILIVCGIAFIFLGQLIQRQF
jgi:NhaP-type Na+/H+ or K+/H+ antiporter